MEDGNPTPGCHPGRKRMERRRRRRTRAESVTSDINSLRNVSSTGIRLSMYFIVARIVKERRVIRPGRMSDLYDDYNNRRAGIIAISRDECRFNSSTSATDDKSNTHFELATEIADTPGNRCAMIAFDLIRFWAPTGMTAKRAGRRAESYGVAGNVAFARSIND